MGLRSRHELADVARMDTHPDPATQQQAPAAPVAVYVPDVGPGHAQAPVPATGFALPAEMAAALDVTAPLAAVTAGPEAPVVPSAAVPASIEQGAPPPAHLPSMAMPAVVEHPRVAPQPIATISIPGHAPGVHSLSVLPEPEDHEAAAQAAAAQAVAKERELLGTVPAPRGERSWDAPSCALMLAIVAMTWQLVAHYAREVLPAVVASGAPLDVFDSTAGKLPFAGSTIGALLGFAMGAAALWLLRTHLQAGTRDARLQRATAVAAVVALLLTVPAFLG